MSSPVSWSEWRPLALPEPLTPTVLAEVLEGGQTFRWARAPGEIWQGVWSDCAVRLKPAEYGGLLWSAPQSLAGTIASELEDYLAVSSSFTRLADGLPWRSDPHLALAAGRSARHRRLRFVPPTPGPRLACTASGSSTVTLKHLAIHMHKQKFLSAR